MGILFPTDSELNTARAENHSRSICRSHLCQSISCDHSWYQFCIRVQSSRQEPHNNLSKEGSLIISRGKKDSKILHGRASKDWTDREGGEPSLRLDQDFAGDGVLLTQQMAEKLAGLIWTSGGPCSLVQDWWARTLSCQKVGTSIASTPFPPTGMPAWFTWKLAWWREVLSTLLGSLLGHDWACWRAAEKPSRGCPWTH